MSAAATGAASAAGPRAAPPSPLTMRDVLRITALRRLWYAQIISTFGDFLALFAVVGFLTFRLHARAQQVNGIQISYLLPLAVLGMLAGVFVDRWHLKRTLVLSDLIRGCLCLLLLLCTQVWHFYLVLAGISVVSSFFGPAQSVVIREAVPLHGLRSSSALMQQVMLIMRIVGPAAAGIVVSVLGWQSCYVLDAASFFGSACFIASLSLERSAPAAAAPPAQSQGAVAKIGHDMRAGLSFIVHHAGLLFVILALTAAMFIMGCFGPLIAVYVRDSLHASSSVYAWASAMIGAGILCGINLLNTLGKKIGNTVLVYGGLLVIALGLVLLCAVTQLWSALLGNFVIGFAVAGIIVPAQTLVQQETPPELMGRVGSTMLSLIAGAQLLGLLLSGALAQITSIRTVFALCAGALVLLTIAGKAVLNPKRGQ